MSFDPSNILVIDFGQLGDVVLSLPALRAIRERFPKARIVVAVGLPAVPIVELSGAADATLPVDRVALRDGPKLRSIANIFRLVKKVRRERFDFVIDLHSLSETNLLGFLSSARARLFGRRPRRSLDLLSNFRPKPPQEDQSKHAVDRYLDILLPLGIKDAERTPRLKTRAEDDAVIEQMLKKEGADMNAPLVGLFPGAGHPGRRWPLARFVELAARLERNDGVRPVLFAGPEEREMVKEMRAVFPRQTVIFDRLTIPQLAAALARLSVFISSSTGPTHIAAAVETPVVVLYGRLTPDSFTPVGNNHRIIFSSALDAITVDEVYEATRSLIAKEHSAVGQAHGSF